jgi:hypothetical protein
MTYTINKSDGTKLVDILDGTIDNTTDLKLIGKNSTTFGESLNEDLVHLLENFSNSLPPGKPITGQLWYNTAESRLQVYTGTTNGWRATGAPVVSQEEPTNFITGDFWINSKDRQLYFFDGSALTLAGPIWSHGQGRTGFVAETLYDSFGNSKPTLQLFVNDSLLGIYSSSEFDPVPAITGFTTIVKGYTSSSAVSNLFNITVSNAQQLGGLNAASYLVRDSSNGNVGSTMSVPLSIASNNGLTLGSTSNVKIKLSGFALQIENSRQNGDVSIRTTNAGGTNSSIYINASAGHVGILTDNPQQVLDVNGNTRIRGDFEVNGRTLTKPFVLTLIDNDILTNTNAKTILILNDIADTSLYLDGQGAFVHYQHINGAVITRYNKKFVITNGEWTFETDLSSSV